MSIFQRFRGWIAEGNDRALAENARLIGTKPIPADWQRYDYAKAIAGKRRAEARDVSRRRIAASSTTARGQRPEVVPMRREA